VQVDLQKRAKLTTTTPRRIIAHQEMHRLLLLLPLLAHALVAARGEGSGAGSGDGSAYEERCREPVPLPEPLGGSLDIGGKMEPRCHLLCTEKVPRYTLWLQLFITICPFSLSPDCYAKRNQSRGLLQFYECLGVASSVAPNSKSIDCAVTIKTSKFECVPRYLVSELPSRLF
jgi:hypothetical protein